MEIKGKPYKDSEPQTRKKYAIGSNVELPLIEKTDFSKSKEERKKIKEMKNQNKQLRIDHYGTLFYKKHLNAPRQSLVAKTIKMTF